MRNTNKKRKRKVEPRDSRPQGKRKCLTREGLVYALKKLRACEAGIKDALAVGRVPRTMFANSHNQRQWWFLEALLNARTCKTLKLRRALLTLRKELLISYYQVFSQTKMIPLIDAWEFRHRRYSFMCKLVNVTLETMQIKGIECNPAEALRIARKTKFDVSLGCQIDLIDLLSESAYHECLTDERNTSMFRDLRRVWNFLLCKEINCKDGYGYGEPDFHSLRTDVSAMKAVSLHIFWGRLSQMTSPQIARHDALLDSFAARIPWARYERAVIQRFPSVLTVQENLT